MTAAFAYVSGKGGTLASPITQRVTQGVESARQLLSSGGFFIAERGQ